MNGAEAAIAPPGHLLAERVVVVSGVGPGLGRSIALRAALAGADVVLAARTEKMLDEVAGEVRDLGRRAHPVRCDVTRAQDAQALLDAALAEFGHVDGLVNNAFAMPPMTALGKVDLDALRAAFEVSAYGTLRLTRTFAPALAEAGGSVVMVNSSVRHHSRYPYGPYKMTKAALLAMAQSLASELGPKGVRVNSVAPGWIWSGVLQTYFAYLAEQRGVAVDEVYRETAAPIDLRRLPVPDEIADTIVFLLSPLARAVTGHCLDVDCGEFHS